MIKGIKKIKKIKIQNDKLDSEIKEVYLNEIELDSEIKEVKDDEIEVKDGEIEVKDGEIEVKDGEIEVKEDEIEIEMLKVSKKEEIKHNILMTKILNLIPIINYGLFVFPLIFILNTVGMNTLSTLSFLNSNSNTSSVVTNPLDSAIPLGGSVMPEEFGGIICISSALSIIILINIIVGFLKMIFKKDILEEIGENNKFLELANFVMFIFYLTLPLTLIFSSIIDINTFKFAISSIFTMSICQIVGHYINGEGRNGEREGRNGEREERSIKNGEERSTINGEERSIYEESIYGEERSIYKRAIIPFISTLLVFLCKMVFSVNSIIFLTEFFIFILQFLISELIRTINKRYSSNSSSSNSSTRRISSGMNLKKKHKIFGIIFNFGISIALILLGVLNKETMIEMYSRCFKVIDVKSMVKTTSKLNSFPL